MLWNVGVMTLVVVVQVKKQIGEKGQCVVEMKRHQMMLVFFQVIQMMLVFFQVILMVENCPVLLPLEFDDEKASKTIDEQEHCDEKKANPTAFGVVFDDFPRSMWPVIVLWVVLNFLLVIE